MTKTQFSKHEHRIEAIESHRPDHFFRIANLPIGTARLAGFESPQSGYSNRTKHRRYLGSLSSDIVAA